MLAADGEDRTRRSTNDLVRCGSDERQRTAGAAALSDDDQIRLLVSRDCQHPAVRAADDYPGADRTRLPGRFAVDERVKAMLRVVYEARTKLGDVEFDIVRRLLVRVEFRGSARSGEA